MERMFYECSSVESIKNIDTNNNDYYFNNIDSLEKVEEMIQCVSDYLNNSKIKKLYVHILTKEDTKQQIKTTGNVNKL
jgi:hypothetical protein